MQLNYESIIAVLRDKDIAERFLSLIVNYHVELERALVPARLDSDPRTAPELTGADMRERAYAVCIGQYGPPEDIIYEMTMAAHEYITFHREIHVVTLLKDTGPAVLHVPPGGCQRPFRSGVHYHILRPGEERIEDYGTPWELLELLDILAGKKFKPHGFLMQAVEALEGSPGLADRILAERRAILGDGIRQAVEMHWDGPEEVIGLKMLQGYIRGLTEQSQA